MIKRKKEKQQQKLTNDDLEVLENAVKTIEEAADNNQKSTLFFSRKDVSDAVRAKLAEKYISTLCIGYGRYMLCWR